MAQYVILAFDNDTEAESFRKMIADEPSDVKTIHVVAAYKKPTVFCVCIASPDQSVRGAKYGWWLCKICHRPKKGLWQGPKDLTRPDEAVRDKRITFVIRDDYVPLAVTE